MSKALTLTDSKDTEGSLDKAQNSIPLKKHSGNLLISKSFTNFLAQTGS